MYILQLSLTFKDLLFFLLKPAENSSLLTKIRHAVLTFGSPMVDKAMLKCTLWHRLCLAFPPAPHSPPECWGVIPEVASRMFLQASKCRQTINLVPRLPLETLHRSRDEGDHRSRWSAVEKCPLVPLDSQGGTELVQDFFVEHSKRLVSPFPSKADARLKCLWTLSLSEGTLSFLLSLKYWTFVFPLMPNEMQIREKEILPQIIFKQNKYTWQCAV